MPHLVKQSKALHFVGSLLMLADAALGDGHFVYLPVVLACLLLKKIVAKPLGAEVSCNAESIRMMRFFDAVANAVVAPSDG